MDGTFLRAEWRKLLMVNYAVDPDALRSFVPYKTEIDLWQNTCYVSLVGFMFLNTRVIGIRIPFHADFEEVNLRFYVSYTKGNERKRGVVFIREIVPRAALTFVANTIYGENYVTMPMGHKWVADADKLSVGYQWKTREWNSMHVNASPLAIEIKEGSEEEFITEHYWGYTKISSLRTSEYQVQHPRWNVYPIKDHTVNVDFGAVYGAQFGFLQQEKPASVFLAEGSEIAVFGGRTLRD
jgi:uncharacterized protein YqjF (DUF2071 family)